MPYIIIKHVKRSTGVVVPVVLLDSNTEVLEFGEHSEAAKFADILELNSDSGHKYEVKKV